MTCVRIIAQAEESVRAVTAAALLSVNVLKTGKGSRVTFLTVQTTVAFLTEASVMQAIPEGAPAFLTGRVLDAQFLCQLTSLFGLEKNILI